MKKITLIVLFVSSILASQSVFFENNITMPGHLKSKIQQYWQYRAKKRFDLIYKFELPYLQYLHSKEWYMNFFAQAPKFSKIIIKKKYKCNKQTCIVGLTLFKRFSREPIFYYDKWINVNGIWYHKYNDAPLPIFR